MLPNTGRPLHPAFGGVAKSITSMEQRSLMQAEPRRQRRRALGRRGAGNLQLERNRRRPGPSSRRARFHAIPDHFPPPWRSLSMDVLIIDEMYDHIFTSREQGECWMKLATYRSGGAVRVGAVDADAGRLFDLAGAARRAGARRPRCFDARAHRFARRRPRSARSLVDRHVGEADLWSDLAHVELLAPLPEPRQMRDAMSFALHIRQAARGSRALQAMRSGGRDAFKAAMAEPLEALASVYREVPIYYITNRFTVVGPGATVKWPRYSQVIDYELEVGIVTRRTRANIPAKEAGAHIFGYTIFNDFSARDRQAVEMRGRLAQPRARASTAPTPLGLG